MTETDQVHVVDRTIWPSGPWDDEPDRIEWRPEGTSQLVCLMVRNGFGAWCGYVGVPPGHLWHGRGYDDVRGPGGYGVDVHGGLTYASECAGHICHVPRPGESDDVWWLGFDCAHSVDAAPGGGWGISSLMGTYRDADYVRAEVERLAEQAQAVSCP